MGRRTRNARPRVGISRCLLGGNVRYDGADRREPALLASLAASVEWVDVCPEVEIGMGVPREPIHLVAGPDDLRVRLVGVNSHRDWTGQMLCWARERVEELGRLNLSGFVLKARSPSCGPRDVTIHSLRDGGFAMGQGLFARALMRAFPRLPVEDEDALRAENARAAFLARVMAYQREGAERP
jgi:uncharacterized protein YbbK (DUF523 family)